MLLAPEEHWALERAIPVQDRMSPTPGRRGLNAFAIGTPRKGLCCPTSTPAGRG